MQADPFIIGFQDEIPQAPRKISGARLDAVLNPRPRGDPIRKREGVGAPPPINRATLHDNGPDQAPSLIRACCKASRQVLSTNRKLSDESIGRGGVQLRLGHGGKPDELDEPRDDVILHGGVASNPGGDGVEDGLLGRDAQVVELEQADEGGVGEVVPRLDVVEAGLHEVPRGILDELVVGVAGPRGVWVGHGGGEDAGGVGGIDGAVGQVGVEDGGEVVEAVAAANREGGEGDFGVERDGGTVHVGVDELPALEEVGVGQVVDGDVEAEAPGGVGRRGRLERRRGGGRGRLVEDRGLGWRLRSRAGEDVAQFVRVDREDGAVRGEGGVRRDYVDVRERVQVVREQGLRYRVRRARVEHGGDHGRGGGGGGGRWVNEREAGNGRGERAGGGSGGRRGGGSGSRKGRGRAGVYGGVDVNINLSILKGWYGMRGAGINGASARYVTGPQVIAKKTNEKWLPQVSIKGRRSGRHLRPLPLA